MFKWRVSPRTLILASLVIMHASIAAALLFVMGAVDHQPGQPTRWPLLALTMGLVAFAEEWRHSREGQWRPGLTVIAALLLLLGGLKTILGGSVNPFGGWGAIVGSGALLSREAFFSLLGLGFVLWRGLRIGTWGGVEIAAFLRRGLIVFIMAFSLGSVMLNTDYDQPENAGWLTIHIVGFIASALTALATEQSINENADQQARPTLLRTLGIVLLTAAGGFVLIALFSSTGRSLLGAAFGGVMWVVAHIAGLAALGIAALLEPLTHYKMQDRGAAGPTLAQQLTPATSGLAPADETRIAGQSDLLGILIQGLAWLLVALIAWLALRTVRRVWRRWRQAKAQDEERASVWNLDDARQDLLNALSALRPKRRAANTLRGTTPILRIRRAYGQFLELDALTGRERRSDQTPREYGEASAASKARQAGAIASLTAAYEAARYGRTASEAAAAAAEATVKQLMKDEGER